jgi:hypothetical protein
MKGKGGEGRAVGKLPNMSRNFSYTATGLNHVNLVSVWLYFYYSVGGRQVERAEVEVELENR